MRDQAEKLDEQGGNNPAALYLCGWVNAIETPPSTAGSGDCCGD